MDYFIIYGKNVPKISKRHFLQDISNEKVKKISTTLGASPPQSFDIKGVQLITCKKWCFQNLGLSD